MILRSVPFPIDRVNVSAWKAPLRAPNAATVPLWGVPADEHQKHRGATSERQHLQPQLYSIQTRRHKPRRRCSNIKGGVDAALRASTAEAVCVESTFNGHLCMVYGEMLGALGNNLQ